MPFFAALSCVIVTFLPAQSVLSLFACC